MPICPTCKNENNGSYGSGRFCNKSCARRYAISTQTYTNTKPSICPNCQKLIQIKVNSDPKRTLCEKCKKIKTCKLCGQTPCKRPDICKKHRVFGSLNKFFGFDLSLIGTENIYQEYERIIYLLKDEYFENKLSVPEIAQKYNHPNDRNLWKILKTIGLDCRSLSESQINSFITGKRTMPENQFNFYKCGYHTTWFGRKVFYRSSYELDYMKILDNDKILYQVESLRILYWDSITKIHRIAIPDFFIASSNSIIEIKSEWTLNIQNMKDKVNSYLQHGYNFKLILEKKEVNFNKMVSVENFEISTHALKGHCSASELHTH